MPDASRPLDFSSGPVEFREEGGEVCVYATKEGLRKLVELCRSLIENPKIGHVHLEDHHALTSDSLGGVISVFDKAGQER
jgi:hypothetical protein